MHNSILSILRLELWKQKRTFFSTFFVLVFGIALPAVFIPVIRSIRILESFTGAAAFLILLMPLVIAFLGASAGGSLRKTEDRNHEELLPVHPLLRVYGAYLVSFFYTGLLFFLAFSLLGIQEIFYLANYRIRLFELPFGNLLLYAWSLHCLSFGMSYVLNLPVLGAGLAVIFSTVDLFVRVVLVNYMRYWYVERSEWHVERLYWPYLTVLMPLACVLISFAVAASKLERGLKPGFRAAFPLLAYFLLGPVISVFLAFTRSAPYWEFFWDRVAATF